MRETLSSNSLLLRLQVGLRSKHPLDAQRGAARRRRRSSRSRRRSCSALISALILMYALPSSTLRVRRV